MPLRIREDTFHGPWLVLPTDIITLLTDYKQILDKSCSLTVTQVESVFRVELHRKVRSEDSVESVVRFLDLLIRQGSHHMRWRYTPRFNKVVTLVFFSAFKTG